MKNILGREGGDRPFEGVHAHPGKNPEYQAKNKKAEKVEDWGKLFNRLPLKDGMVISFHHHMRNGDFVLNKVMEEIHKRGLKDITLAASSLFPCHEPLAEMMKDETVTTVYTSYMSGPVAKAISKGALKNPAYITTHGGRPRSIIQGELKIDIAFVAAPAVDPSGAISGSEGPSACGSLGYAVADAQYADVVVALTDHPVDQVKKADIEAGCVDYIYVMDQIGDPTGIVSGTTKVTKDPIGLRIANQTARVMDALGLIKDGLSFQTGAGGTSLAVAAEVRSLMKERNLKGSFGCGGITGYFVNMLEEGLFEDLYDVQGFDIDAAKSAGENDHHHKISADLYANPDNPDHVAGKLDAVILGCSEIDLDFNVNVTTGSDGIILGGSGGHADTATGAKVSIITTKLFNARMAAVVDSVRTVTTPGEAVDILVTDYGVAVNPKRQDLIDKLKDCKQVELKTIEELHDKVLSFTGTPKKRPRSGKPIAYSVYRDGTILDTVDKVEE